jgi:ribokinase
MAIDTRLDPVASFADAGGQHDELVTMTVYVAGSINMDVVATAARHPKIGETVAGRDLLYCPGGKGANQAVAAARLGAATSLIGRTGRDGFGADLRAFLAAQGVDLTHVRDCDAAPTGTAVIVVAEKDNTIVVVPGANAELSAADVQSAAIARGDVLVSQFEIPLPTVAAFFARGRAVGARTILNPAPALQVDRALLALADLIILNETELALLAHREVDADAAPADLAAVARALRTHADQLICVTIGKRGAIAVAGEATHVIAGREVGAIDTTGAGDCFTGAVAAELARGRPIADALDFANRAASICVQRMGAGPSMPSRDEVLAVS